MCTFHSDTEVMVCDISRDHVRSVLSASLGRSVSFETVHGQGTRVRCMESERSAEFVALLDTALEAYRSPAT